MLPKLKGVSFANTGVNEEVIPLLQSHPSLEWATIPTSSPEVEKRLVAEQEETRTKPHIYFR